LLLGAFGCEDEPRPRGVQRPTAAAPAAEPSKAEPSDAPAAPDRVARTAREGVPELTEARRRELLERLRRAVGDPGSCFTSDDWSALSGQARLEVEVQVSQDGRVTDVQVGAPGFAERVRRCVAARARALSVDELERPVQLRADWMLTPAEPDADPGALQAERAAAERKQGTPEPGPPSSGRWIQGPSGVAIGGPSGQEIDGPSGRPIDDESAAPIEGPSGQEIAGPSGQPIHAD
jgi:hypothetical protein